MIFWFQRLGRKREDSKASTLESPWCVLANTGNGIGHAPSSLRAIPGLDDDGFEELYCGELVDKFWHQGTIYAATPFAVGEVVGVLHRTKPKHQESLLEWLSMCLEAERLGAAKPSYSGVWLPEKDLEHLRASGLKRPTVEQTLLTNLQAISVLVGGPHVGVRRAVEKLVSALENGRLMAETESRPASGVRPLSQVIGDVVVSLHVGPPEAYSGVELPGIAGPTWHRADAFATLRNGAVLVLKPWRLSLVAEVPKGSESVDLRDPSGTGCVGRKIKDLLEVDSETFLVLLDDGRYIANRFVPGGTDQGLLFTSVGLASGSPTSWPSRRSRWLQGRHET